MCGATRFFSKMDLINQCAKVDFACKSVRLSSSFYALHPRLSPFAALFKKISKESLPWKFFQVLAAQA